MPTNKKGRPKQEQTKPIIFERFRSRVTRPLSMSAKTAADLDRYIEWACAEVGAEASEALTLVLDQALAQLFQRDKLFQEALKQTEVASAGKAATASSSGAAPQPRPAVGSGTGAASSSTNPASSSTVVVGAGKGAPGPQMAVARPGTAQ